MPYYDAVLADARVAVDGNIISADGVIAGLDAALVLVSLLRGEAAAQEIQPPSSMHRTLYSIVVLQKMRRLRFSRAFGESTIRSVPHGRQKLFAMQKHSRHCTQKHEINPTATPSSSLRRPRNRRGQDLQGEE
jgi:hypothetical protein